MEEIESCSKKHMFSANHSAQGRPNSHDIEKLFVEGRTCQSASHVTVINVPSRLCEAHCIQKEPNTAHSLERSEPWGSGGVPPETY
jgi:hypothetical protein